MIWPFKKKRPERIVIGWNYWDKQNHPTDLIRSVIRDTGLVLGEPTTWLVYNYVWDIPTDQLQLYKEKQQIIYDRLFALYEAETIFYMEC